MSIISLQIFYTLKMRFEEFSKYANFGDSNERLEIIKANSTYCNKSLVLLSIHTNSALSEKKIQVLVELACNYLHVIYNVKEALSLSNRTLVPNGEDGNNQFKHEYRLSCIMLEQNSLTSNLSNELMWLGGEDFSNKEKPKIAFLFTGQGSQYPQMGKGFYENSPVFRKAFDECSQLLRNNFPIPIEDTVYGSNSILLDSSLYSQTSIFCLEYGLVELWKSFGIEPDYVLGPSAGAFCAAYTAGILSLQDSLKLIRARGELIQNLHTGGMTAVRSTVPEVKKMLSYLFDNDDSNLWLDIAVINSPDDIVVAGRCDALNKFESYCSENSIKFLRLAANQAFHSREIEGIREDYEKVLSEVKCSNANNCAYVSGVTGNVVGPGEFTSKYWQSHARDPVDFPAAIQTLYNEGCRIFIEVGPQPTLLTVGKHNLGDDKVNQSVWLSSLKKSELEWNTLLNNLQVLFLQGIDIHI